MDRSGYTESLSRLEIYIIMCFPNCVVFFEEVLYLPIGCLSLFANFLAALDELRTIARFSLSHLLLRIMLFGASPGCHWAHSPVGGWGASGDRSRDRWERIGRL